MMKFQISLKYIINRMFHLITSQPFFSSQTTSCLASYHENIFQTYLYFFETPLVEINEMNSLQSQQILTLNIEENQSGRNFNENSLNSLQIESRMKKQMKDYLILKNTTYQQQSNRQKFGRNIVSNIFHLMIKFIKHEKKVKKTIEKIIASHGMIIKINQFFKILNKKHQKLSAYATIKQIREFWGGKDAKQVIQECQKRKYYQCSKICRIIGMNYLEIHHLPYVYNSRKIKAASRRLHMNAIRNIYNLQS